MFRASILRQDRYHRLCWRKASSRSGEMAERAQASIARSNQVALKATIAAYDTDNPSWHP